MPLRATTLSTIGAAMACAIALPAAAFAPAQDVDQGYAPTRVQHYSLTTQAELRSSEAWRRFVDTESVNWTVRFDELTGQPLRMYGAPINIGPTDSELNVLRGLRGLLARHQDLTTVSPKQLGAGTASYSKDVDTWYIDLPSVFEGVPVYQGGVTARVKAGNLVMLGLNTYGDSPRMGNAVIDANEAVQIAIDLGPARDANHARSGAAELVWLPYVREGEVVLLLAYKTRTVTADPVGEWTSFVDAETGELLNFHNEVLFFNVEGTHHDRHPGNPKIASAMRNMYVRNAENRQATTGETGGFDLAGDSFTARMEGPNLRVVDSRDSRTGTIAFGGQDVVWQTDQELAERSSWVFVNQVQDWGKSVAPEVNVRSGGGALKVSTSIKNGSCNAYYNQQGLNFFDAGGGCNNTGLIADVNYHEWGHGFHAYSLHAGQFDGSISEGSADTVTFLMTDHNIIGPYFRTNGNGIRNVAPNRVYPRDLRNQVHADGLIWAGAMWDLVRLLEKTEGNAEARASVGKILAGALKAGPTLATVGAEALLADDDDGDLSNGTPHYCELSEVLAAHGLLPEGGVSAMLLHEQIVQTPAGSPHPVSATVQDMNATCVDFEDVRVQWRVPGGDWAAAPADLEGNEVSAQLPQHPYGTFIEYYFETGAQTDIRTTPGGGFTNPLSMFVGDVIELRCEGFENDDGGYTHELISGEDREGADDWMWGEPKGMGGDAAKAATGFNVWGNDLGGGNFNGQYQSDKKNRLTSPMFETLHYEDVFLRYDRWLQVEDGNFDQANILADGEVVWTNYNSGTEQGGFHHADARWVTHSVSLGDATADGQVQLAWEINSDGGLTMGGWTLDNVCIYAPATPNNRLAILDFQAGDNEEGGVTLTWTNPKHEPLAEVVVVRKEGEPPTGPDDGEVVFRDTEPQLDAPVTAFDDTGERGKEYWYAVYGGDGDDWLGWTNEARNLDLGSGFGQPKNGGIAGCSCDATTSGGSAGFLLLAALGLVARRRRRS